MEEGRKAIGGYFELELPLCRHHIYPSAYRYQSARAAFLALLLVGKPDRVWVPRYICDAMLAPLAAANVEVVFYDLDVNLYVEKNVAIAPRDWLLYVNYFGICNKQEQDLLKRFNPSQLVFDHSQAFFASPTECLATIYSPRKFFGVPDGGLLVTSLDIALPEAADLCSVRRSLHLLIRADVGAEVGYENFKLAEQSLNDLTPRGMSQLTQKILYSIDHEAVRRVRNENFKIIHAELKELNELEIDIGMVDAPLCYPLLSRRPIKRDLLVKNKIFIAKYWPEVLSRSSDGSVEYSLTENCFPIPCDHRYGMVELQFVIDLIKYKI